MQSPVRLAGAPGGARLDQVDDEHDGRADEDPGELIPMEEGNACEPRLDPVIGRHPHDRGEGNNEKQPRPMTQPAAMRLFCCHDAIPPGQSLAFNWGRTLLKALAARDGVYCRVQSKPAGIIDLG
jgi:hypothetical protein